MSDVFGPGDLCSRAATGIRISALERKPRKRLDPPESPALLIGSYRSFPCVGPGRNGWFLLHQFLLLRCEDMKAGALVRWRHKDSRIAEETLYLITKVR
jgi:hypothetical protein